MKQDRSRRLTGRDDLHVGQTKRGMQGVDIHDCHFVERMLTRKLDPRIPPGVAGMTMSTVGVQIRAGAILERGSSVLRVDEPGQIVDSPREQRTILGRLTLLFGRLDECERRIECLAFEFLRFEFAAPLRFVVRSWSGG